MLDRIMCIGALSAVTFFSWMSVSQASLIGDTVDISWLFPTKIATDTVVVSATDPELTCPASTSVCFVFVDQDLIFDLGDFTLGFYFMETGSTFTDVFGFNGPLFESLDLGAPITGFLLDTDFVGLDASRISFGADFLSVDLSGLPFDNSFFVITLTTATEVPEPASLAIFGAGLAAFGLLRRRRRA